MPCWFPLRQAFPLRELNHSILSLAPRCKSLCHCFKVGYLEHDEIEGFASGHKAAKCHRQDLNPGGLAPECVALTLKLWGRQSQWAMGLTLQVLETQVVRGGGAGRNSGSMLLLYN